MKIVLSFFIFLSLPQLVLAMWPFRAATPAQCIQLFKSAKPSLGIERTGPRSLSVNIGARVKHDDYAEGMWTGVLKATQLVRRDGAKTDLFQVLKILADRRREVAFESKDPEAPNYGVLRREPSPENEEMVRTRTPSNDRYNKSILEGQRYSIAAGKWPLATTARLGFRFVELTHVFWDKPAETFRYYIMGARDSYRVLEHVRKQFTDILKIENDPAKVIRETAKIHWWLAQAMPYARGSAAIADALTKVIFIHHGISVGEWRNGITPDVVAFMVSAETFADIYPDLFTQP